MRKFVNWAAAAAMLVIAPLAMPTTASADSVSVTVGDGPVRHHWRDGQRYQAVDYRRDWRRDRRDWRRHHRPDVCRVIVKKRVVWRNGHRVVITDRVRRCRDW